MLSRSALLYLSRRNGLKDFLAKFPGFKQITSRFIAGENIHDAIEAITELNRQGITASFDHLGEATSSAQEAEADVREYLLALDRIDATGVDSNISIKLTQLGLDIDYDFCLGNVEQIVAEAKRRGNFVRIDMEDSSKTDSTLKIFKKVFDDYGNVGIVLQSYLYRTDKDLDEVLDMGARVRLCKGAYQENEDVAFQAKSDVDRNFIHLMRRLLKSDIYHAIATHDENMISETIDFVDREKIRKDSFEFQMLYGVRRDLQMKLVDDGFRMRTYVPYGEYWYPYFMRRLAERPANVWFVVKNLYKG